VTPTPRSLDHFAISVLDAESAGDRYERLGFQVQPLTRHIEIGSCNRVIQFPHSYLEVVGDLDKSAAVLRERMMPRFACGEGLSIVSLTASNLVEDSKRLRDAGFEIEPISNARRTVVMPDGSTSETDSRCVYVWRPGRMYTTLFYSEHHKPETIWVPAYQNHPNSARRIKGLTYVSDSPEADVQYVSELLGIGPVLSTADHVVFETARGESIEFLSPELLIERFGNACPPLCAFEPAYGVALEIEVESLDTCAACLQSNGIDAQRLGDRLRVPAAAAHGVVLDFVSAKE
jgi:hypothetical protein